jgi:hypothetical protein
MFDKLRNMLGLTNWDPMNVAPPGYKEKLEAEKKSTTKKPRAKKKKVEAPAEPILSAKEQATANGEPYINILKIDVDPNNINNGAFELDWNDKFVINLIKAGYKLRPDDADADIVDRWFTQVCRNVALEVYEQQQADPDNRNQMRVIQTKDLGDGRSEVS